MRLTQIAACALAFGSAIAQQGQRLHDQFVGTLTFVVAEITAPDDQEILPVRRDP
jgi:hypothetical protein